MSIHLLNTVWWNEQYRGSDAAAINEVIAVSKKSQCARVFVNSNSHFSWNTIFTWNQQLKDKLFRLFRLTRLENLANIFLKMNEVWDLKKKNWCVLLMMKHMLSNKTEFYKTCIQKVSLLCKLPCEPRNANMLKPGSTLHTSNGLPKALLRSVMILINVVLGIPYQHLVSKPVFQNY